MLANDAINSWDYLGLETCDDEPTFWDNLEFLADMTLKALAVGAVLGAQKTLDSPAGKAITTTAEYGSNVAETVKEGGLPHLPSSIGETWMNGQAADGGTGVVAGIVEDASLGYVSASDNWKYDSPRDFAAGIDIGKNFATPLMNQVLMTPSVGPLRSSSLLPTGMSSAKCKAQKEALRKHFALFKYKRPSLPS